MDSTLEHTRSCRYFKTCGTCRTLKYLQVFQARIGGRFAPLLFLVDPQALADSMTKQPNKVAENVLGKKQKKTGMGH